MKRNEIIIYADGFMTSKREPVPGYSVAAFLNDEKIYSDKKIVTEVAKKYRGYFTESPQTNNTFEYLALFSALQLCRKLIKIYRLEEYDYYIYMDSEVVLKQFKQEYCINLSHLRVLNNLCQEQFSKIKDNNKVNINWIKRKKIVEILGH